MRQTEKPIANPLIVLREEFDDWAILFDPDTGDAFGVNPIGVRIWKRLDGTHSVADILKDLQEGYEDVPDAAEGDLQEFIEDLVQRGLAGYEVQKA
ncbi:MAG: pyrroloquinoline quinone biosynthesis protein PqqD [Nitrospira bacterium SG8_3]|nr:MAG: pyrroloquinoline quinone biosynthesis protein PqqD [Nitrospira bacterium SG8_3]